MSRDVISVEIDNHGRSVPQWEEVLSRHVGKVPPALRDQEVTDCHPSTAAPFRARLEYGALGESILYKIKSTPNHYSRSLRNPASTTLPSPILLVVELNGSHRIRQPQGSFVLRPGDWCLVDTLLPLDYWTSMESAELLVLTLPRPSTAEQQALHERGIARRWCGKVGTARVLESTLAEIFDQMNSIAPASGDGLQHALTTMTWDALREQLAAPSPLTYLDAQRSRIKAYIDAQLGDPDLSVESIAQACGLSVRSLHRTFASDPAGSVSSQIWKLRLHRCADALRDPTDARRSIAAICRSWGFSSESHFSRLFKEQFGVSPRAYRNGGPIS